MSDPSPAPGRVQLFVTCMIEAVRPEAGLAVVDVLEALGLTVDYPEDQTCCGQPAFNAGSWDDAAAMARHTLDVLSRSDAPIIIPSGSCGDMVRHHYPRLLEGDPVYGPLAAAVAERAFEFSEFLYDVLGVGREAASPAETTGEKVTYHPSCHLLRGMGVREAPRALLSAAGVELVELPNAEECCGFGGLFAVKMSDISGAMLQRKLDAIEDSGASTVVSCDVSCLIHIAGGLHRRGSAVQTKHIAEVLRP
jgi:L-lactate dehydrogenase complex protein LldE